MALSNKIKIEVESDQSDQPYREVRRSEEEVVEVEVPVFKRRKFDPNKISPAMLRDHCRYFYIIIPPYYLCCMTPISQET